MREYFCKRSKILNEKIEIKNGFYTEKISIETESLQPVIQLEPKVMLMYFSTSKNFISQKSFWTWAF